ncbi:MAG: hypothetical protein ACRD1Y_12140 [Terriglobales bacterium]
MATSAQPGAARVTTDTPDAARARVCLLQLVGQYGLALCADPWRCEALLRDGCGGSRREIFWLTAALRHNLVADICGARRDIPDAVLRARLAHKLAEELGLAPEPAQWAAEVWLEAVRSAPPASAAAVLPEARAPLPEWPAPGPASSDLWTQLPTGLDARWIALCLASVGLSAATVAVITRVAFAGATLTPGPWLADTARLAIGLALCAAGEWAVARALRRGPRCRPAPGQAPWALAPELLSLVAQPAALVGGLAIWVCGWVGAAHAYGPGGGFTFTLGRVVQTFLVAAFCWKWADWMTDLQGRVAARMVRVP